MIKKDNQVRILVTVTKSLGKGVGNEQTEIEVVLKALEIVKEGNLQSVDADTIEDQSLACHGYICFQLIALT
jgi:hypothetical protein